jgi:hypothetical protein
LLGDFGYGFVSNNNPLNPSIYQIDGTKGFRVPEQHRFYDPNSYDQIDIQPMNAKTNVFGIGMILHCLLFPEPDPDEPDWYNGDEAYDLSRSNIYYSDALNTMVRSCLRFSQANRPTFQQLRTIIDNAVDGPDDRTKGMRNGTVTADALKDHDLPYGSPALNGIARE